MNPFKIGHYSDSENGTGCTVVLAPKNTVGSGVARGAAPATREYALLSPQKKVENIHAIFLTGGSAFGLDAAAGVMRFLAERGIGHATPFRNIPIVPAAVIYDLYCKNSKAFPFPDDAYEACQHAKLNNIAVGSIGAGTGASIGKWAGLEYAMKGGIGRAQIKRDALFVDALCVVNPVGDVVGPDGKIICGARKGKKFIARDDLEQRWQPPAVGFGENTVLCVVMTNALLNKNQLHYVSERSHNGIVRAIVPAHTQYDGDIVFALSSGKIRVSLDLLCEMSIEAVRRAIISAASASNPDAFHPAVPPPPVS